MVARPRKNEKIVISTMALDWAGHYELIENILYYLIIGIPTVAFVDKEEQPVQDFQFLLSEAELSNISYLLIYLHQKLLIVICISITHFMFFTRIF